MTGRTYRAIEGFTERQVEGWYAAVEELQRYTYVTSNPAHSTWTIIFDEEVRPGRGRAINAIWCDGEHFAQITMDVYGYPTVSIATLDWVHNSADEECPCPVCTKERENDDEEG